jgi:hypothetical protein
MELHAISGYIAAESCAANFEAIMRGDEFRDGIDAKLSGGFVREDEAACGDAGIRRESGDEGAGLRWGVEIGAAGDVGFCVGAVGEIDLDARDQAAEFVEDGEGGGLGGDDARGENDLSGFGGLGAGDLRRDGKNRDD